MDWEKWAFPCNARLDIETRARGDAGEAYRPLSASDPALGLSIADGDGGFSHPWQLRLDLKNGAKPWAGILHFTLRVPDAGARFFLPAFLYGNNEAHREGGQYPRLRPGEVSIPKSPYWMVRSDRLSHPVAMLYAQGHGFGISCAPYLVRNGKRLEAAGPGAEAKNHALFNGFSCSLADASTVGFTLGYENAPALYVSNYMDYVPREELGQNCLELASGESLQLEFHLYAAPGEDERCLSHILKNVYARHHDAPRRLQEPRDTVRLLAEAIDRDSYLPEFKNYSTQVYRKSDPHRKQANRVSKETATHIYQAIPSIAWTGGLECAVPVLQAALLLRDEKMRAHALESIQHVVDGSLNPKSGLPYDAYDVKKDTWSVDGWWRSHFSQSGHSSYLVGQALFYLLKAYRWEERHGDTPHEDWLLFCKQVLDRALETQNGEGEYPYLWSQETGEALEWDGFCGCWVAAALALYAQITKDDSLLAEAHKSEGFYHRKFVRRFCCYGTPHDTYRAPDSEGVLAYIHLSRILHEETGDGRYLSSLVDGLEYEFSWKFCYNVPVQVPPLSTVGWHSSGGSVTSVCNPHVHPMSQAVMEDLHYAWKQTGDRHLLDRLKDSLLWSLQTSNTREREYGFGEIGWMSERFCHSQGLLEERWPDGSPASTWFCYLPWGAANLVEGLCDLWEEAPGILAADQEEGDPMGHAGGELTR